MEEVGVSRKDSVVGIAASRRTPYVQGALEKARSLGAFTALVTCNPGAAEGSSAEVVIAPVVGPEVVSGSTRMKAGTAQKLVLNMISTASMIRRGKTLGNLMIDLRPGSAKLIERSRRIVMKVVGVDYAAATSLLEGAGGRVKIAIVMGAKGVDREAAARLLEEASGFVRRVLEK
jgi:N-acetylmuramic acid 6-phosphate etherase